MEERLSTHKFSRCLNCLRFKGLHKILIHLDRFIVLSLNTPVLTRASLSLISHLLLILLLLFIFLKDLKHRVSGRTQTLGRSHLRNTASFSPWARKESKTSATQTPIPHLDNQTRLTTHFENPQTSLAATMAPIKSIRLKEVVYTLSPFEQSVMSGLYKHGPYNFIHTVRAVKFVISSI